MAGFFVTFAAMKARHAIGIFLLLLALADCTEPTPEPIEGAERPASELAAIDSLLWQQPDSALARLLPWIDTCCEDVARNVSTPPRDRHYANLLLAELLYKNDYAQTNRDEVLQAVAYYDSLMQVADKRGVSLLGRKGGRRGAPRDSAEAAPEKSIAFLAARAHYINGVGHFEQDSAVAACKEYIAALETMELHFEEKELTGKRARFMALTCNRLGDLFSEQFMSEHAITCYKQSLNYCRRQPTSKYGIPVLLYQLGLLYDIAEQKDSAAFYYGEALASMPDSDNVHFRDLSLSMILFDYYSLGYGRESVINDLKRLAVLSADDDELTTRLLTIGNVLFDEKQYDSSLVYLEAAFERKEDVTSKMMAAEKLAILYQQKGDSLKAQGYVSFLAGFTMSEIERKAEVSKTSGMFREHLARRQEKQAEEERKRLIRSVIKAVVPITVASALLAIFLLTLRHKKLLKRHREEAERRLGETEQEHERELRLWQVEAEKALEAAEKRHREALETKKDEAMRYAEALESERQTHRMALSSLSGRLRQRNHELRELKERISQLDNMPNSARQEAVSFADEPICRLILERVEEGKFLSQMDCSVYKQYALGKDDLFALREACNRHFNQFTFRLSKDYPELTSIDLHYCCLYLLHLSDADVSALMQRAYNTVNERNNKLRKIFGSKAPVPVTLQAMANDYLSH